LALNTPVSEGLRALAEKNVAQTREAYERSKDALEAGLETLERSFDALGQGAVGYKTTGSGSAPGHKRKSCHARGYVRSSPQSRRSSARVARPRCATSRRFYPSRVLLRRASSGSPVKMG
jgi:hypothetical protein